MKEGVSARQRLDCLRTCILAQNERVGEAQGSLAPQKTIRKGGVRDEEKAVRDSQRQHMRQDDCSRQLWKMITKRAGDT